MLPVAALLFAFASMPGSHSPRRPATPLPPDRPLFVADMERLSAQRGFGSSSQETATPALDPATTRMYVGLSDGMVRCRFHGRNVWSYDSGGSVLAAPLVDGETLYVASASGKLAALNRITGEPRWILDVHEELTTTPTIGEGKVFVMSSDEAVTAVDVASGKSLWKFRRERPAGFTLRGNARPQLAHGLLYTGFADGTVAALEPATGVARWLKQISGPGDYLDVDALSAPEDDKRVYAASAKGGLVALDAQSGEEAFRVALPGANQVVASGARIFASGRGELIGLDRASGEKLWVFKISGDQYATAAAVARDVLVFAEQYGPLIALDTATGRVRSVIDPGTGFAANGFSEAPLVIPGAAFIISNTGTLFSLGLLP